jgi:hypothetical protein
MIIGLSIFLPTLFHEFKTIRKNKNIMDSLTDAIAHQESKLHQYSSEIENIRLYSANLTNASLSANLKLLSWIFISLIAFIYGKSTLQFIN